jgi:hypothetical protein
MSAGNFRIVLLLLVLSCCSVTSTYADSRASLTVSQARKALTRIPGFELKSGAIRVKSVIASDAAAAEVSAEIRLVFKFEKDENGKWLVAEVRTGQDRWVRIDLIARALNTKLIASDCTAPDPPFTGKLAIDPSVRRARCLLGDLLGLEVPSDALRIQTVAPMAIPMATQPSATVVAWVRVDARLTQASSGWQLSELRTGNRDWVKFEPVIASIHQEKQKRARAELEMMAAALEKFRRERGFYVVSDKQATAIDYLSPRYLPRVIRIDPWNQPYLYLGERDRFTLRSAGPDGKPDTPDDISVQSR